MVVLFWYGLCGLFGSRMHIQGQLMLIGVLMVGKDERLQWVVLGWAVGFVCKRYTLHSDVYRDASCTSFPEDAISGFVDNRGTFQHY